MRFVLFLALLSLTTQAQAQDKRDECLIDSAVGRVSGKVEFVTYKHPGNDWTISGYKLVLLKPRCFELISWETEQPVRGKITEVAIQHGGFEHEFLENHVGKTIAVTGSMFGHTTIYYVTTPAIFMQSMVACAVAPKSKAVEKC